MTTKKVEEVEKKAEEEAERVTQLRDELEEAKAAFVCVEWCNTSRWCIRVSCFSFSAGGGDSSGCLPQGRASQEGNGQ